MICGRVSFPEPTIACNSVVKEYVSVVKPPALRAFFAFVAFFFFATAFSFFLIQNLSFPNMEGCDFHIFLSCDVNFFQNLYKSFFICLRFFLQNLLTSSQIYIGLFATSMLRGK